jgi:hypothetical protein
MGNGQPDARDDEFSNSLDTVIVTADASAPAVFLQDARSIAWALDGRSLAYLATTGARIYREGEPSPPAAIVVIDADGSAATTIVGAAETVTPLADSPAWFVWAVPR